MPRLFVSNNDCTMRVYNVATHPSASSEDVSADGVVRRKKRPHRLTKAGVLQASTCINHGQFEHQRIISVTLTGAHLFDRALASVSPDGRTLLSVGDTCSVYLHSISGGDNVSFTEIATHSDAFSDASFSTAWSPDGLKYAVASQDGCVKVWDVRS